MKCSMVFKKKRKWLCAAVFLLLLVSVSGCGGNEADSSSGDAATGLDVTDMFSDGDMETAYDEAAAVKITLNGDSAACDDGGVTISGSSITLSDEGTYILAGTLDNGTVTVNAEKTDEVRLVLDGASLNSDTSAAIYVAQADKVFITLAPDSQNTVSNGGTFAENGESNIDAAVFAKDDLTLNGEGTLTVTSPAGHGVVSKDDLVVTGGVYQVTAAGQGLSGKESLRVAGGNFTLNTGKDGLRAENADDASSGFVYIADGTFSVTADGDGISASGVMEVDGGDFSIVTGGGSDAVSVDDKGNMSWTPPDREESVDAAENTVSAKGVKATGNLVVTGGSFTVDSADDAFHSNANLTVSGGTITLSTGDDGFHADETAAVTGGNLAVTKSYEGLEGGNIEISGGTLNMVSSDDGLNAAGGNDQSGSGGFDGNQGGYEEDSDHSVTISGGSLVIDASGDGVDSNGSLVVSGGETYISGPANDGNGALDYAGEASITGGVFVAAGSAGMALNFGDSSTQGSVLAAVSGSAGEALTFTDVSGGTLLEWTAAKDFSSVLISVPGLFQGETYTLTLGDTTEEITMEELVYSFGAAAGTPGGGQTPPDGGNGNPGGGQNPPEGGNGNPGGGQKPTERGNGSSDGSAGDTGENGNQQM